MTAPDESVTVPEMVPRNSWAWARTKRNNEVNAMNATGRNPRQPLEKARVPKISVIPENLSLAKRLKIFARVQAGLETKVAAQAQHARRKNVRGDSKRGRACQIVSRDICAAVRNVEQLTVGF